MKKYKLIKELPFKFSPKIGYISEVKFNNGFNPFGDHYWNHNWFDPADYPEYWEELPDKIFTTEDGVDLFEGDKYYWVSKSKHAGIAPFTVSKSFKATLETDDIVYDYKLVKYFSSKKNAKEYVRINKPFLSINDIHESFKKVLPKGVIDMYLITEDELVK